MWPSVLAGQIVTALEDFLVTGFESSTPFFDGLIERFLAEPGSLYKGPYLSVDLPFKRARPGLQPFPHVPLTFTPYQHQALAFERLRSARGLSTLVATGTGSGKTECFLFPILDHCATRAGQKGVKAILIYPMNALATDQAKRFARLIHGNPALRGKVSAGLYVGRQEHAPEKAMGPDSLITDKETLRQHPPDILLTNYKMLDLLLMRPRDQALWRHNGAGVLRYLVVDELHTFDGAQGTDLACLTRRLKARLAVERGGLVCVGTSATLGTDESREDLLQYAARVFDEPFAADAVVGETRQTVDEFLGDSLITYTLSVPPDIERVVDHTRYRGVEDYLRAQHRLFFGADIEGELAEPGWRVGLGDRLRRHALFVNLLRVLERQPRSLPDVIGRFRGSLPIDSDRVLGQLLNALCALVATARAEPAPATAGDGPAAPGARPGPLVQLRLQLWVRELRRMVASVRAQPAEVALRHADDLKGDEEHRHLPVVQCRACHATAWGGVQGAGDGEVGTDLRTFYNHFFGGNGDTRLLFPLAEGEPAPGHVRTLEGQLCASCGNLQPGKARLDRCPACGGAERVRVAVPDLVRTVTRGGVSRTVMSRDCPFCGARDGLIVFGARATSLLSVAVSQGFASAFNDDRKLITFSDSVQDAAHRAGFFAARTWPILLRSAIAQTLDRVGRLPCDQVARHVIAWWTDSTANPQARDAERFVADFLAPDKTWFRDYTALLATGQLPAGSDLAETVRRRLEWEVLAEIGYRSQVGRTLERTRVAALGFERGPLEAAVHAATLRLRETIGPLRDIEPAAVRQLALGFLRHAQQRGGIFHPALAGYLEHGADAWMLSRLRYLPALGPRSVVPVFPTGGQRTGNLERLLAPPGQPKSWYQAWSERVLEPRHPLAASTYAAEIWQTVVDALLDAGLLLRVEYRGDPIWAIRPERAYVSRQVAVLRGGRGSRPLVVPEEEAGLWVGTPSLDGAPGSTYVAETLAPTWFGRLYLTGELHRTVAREHTGLLEREEREALEEAFIAGAHPWDPNLLSATPTLEMGIDIGDLSSVFLCSVPPAQANYLQRVGRAGRRDGNALSLTVATGRPHDLYFYVEPEQMMRGRVEAPGVFLNASAVLERQLTAFCLDRWVASGAREEAIPPTVKTVLDHVEAAKLDGFPFNFLDFVKGEGPELLEAFLALFRDELSPDSRDYLRQFLEGSGEAPGLGPRLVNRLLEVVKERKSVKAQTEALKRRIDGLRAAVQDEATQAEIGDLRQERAGLQAVLRQMNGRETMGFLTDEGLIPNYAFPEAGVTLKSVIFRRREQVEDEDQRYETLVFEYERPGAAAIGELAPESDFYAGGRKVRVDQIDMRLSSIEEWRFCPSCSHLERVDTGDHHTLCPRCGDPLWGDAGQRRPMVRLRQVLASTPDRKSRITDDRDDREPVFYTRQMLVGFEPAAVRAAYSVASPDFPFGFEYLARVSFREVNFGEHSASPTTLAVAGVSLPRRGFRICRHCGKVQPAYANQPEHTPICSARNREAPDAIVDCLYLYREFSSEAIRLLLPPALFAGSEKKLTSFIAALQLGLRKSFGGSVDHLRVMSYEEPLPGSSARKRFLVLYDTVPGGTGYLKDLVRSDQQLMAVLERAARVLRDCACNHDPARDGCYSCIYAYRNSYGMQSTSRSAAAAVLGEILSRREDLQPVKTLDQVAVNAVFDSELEARFVEALKRVRLPGVGISVRQEVVGGKPGYFLSVGERSYYVEPQVPLGPTDGVAVPSQPDFVIRPARARADTLPIAVFTDGFEYHRQIVGEDLRKRMAIVRSRQYLQWSLTWHDVEAVLQAGPGDWSDAAPAADPARAELRRRMLAALNATALADVSALTSLEILFRYLAAPDAAQWQALAFADSLTWFESGEMLTDAFAGLFQSALASHLPEPIVSRFRDVGAPRAAGGYGRWRGDASAPLSAWVSVPLEAIRVPAAGQLVAAVCLHDEEGAASGDPFRRHWNGALRRYNLLQFLPHAFCVSTAGVRKHLYDELESWAGQPAPSAAGLAVTTGASAEALALVDPALRELVASLGEAGGAVPVVGYELTDTRGAVVAEAELAWPAERVAVLLPEQSDGAAAFRAEGWTIVRCESLPDAEQRLRETLLGDSHGRAP